MTTQYDVLTRLRDLMRDSHKFSAVQQRYYFDYNEDYEAPCVILFVDAGVIDEEGIGWERESVDVSVWYVEKSLGSTKTINLYSFVENLRALLNAQPRLGSLTECERANLRRYKQRFGARGDYMIDVMEAILGVWLYRTV